VALGVGLAVGVVGWAATKIVTGVPLTAELLPVGFCAKTFPGVVPAGAPDSVFDTTLNPAVWRSCVAVACESPTTDGTGTAPPETVSVIWVPGGSLVPAAGDCFVTWPAGTVDAGSDTVL
jgi:hypothetical protein